MIIRYHSTMDQYRLKSKPHCALTILFSVFFFLVLSAPSAHAQVSSTDNSSTTSTSFNLPFILIFVALIVLFIATSLCVIFFSCPTGPNPLTNVNRTTSTNLFENGSQWVIPSVRQPGLDKSILEAFPIVKFSEIKGLNLGTLECAVCLSEYNDLDTLRILPGCCHVFHPACIDHWLSNHEVCPICRASLTNQNIMSTESQTETENDGVIMKGTERFTLRLPDHVLRQIEVQRGYKLSASIAGSGYQGTPMSKSGRVWAFIRTFSSRRGQEVGGGSRTIRLGGSLHRNPTLGRNGSIQEMPVVRSGSVRAPIDVVACGMMPLQSESLRGRTEMVVSSTVLLQSGSVGDQTNTIARSESTRGQTDMGTSSKDPTQSDSVRCQIDTTASTTNPELCGSAITRTNMVESGMELVLSVSESVSARADMGNSIIVPVHEFNDV